MSKTIPKFAHVALALILVLPLAQAPADARPSGSSSFKSGFSSQRTSSSSSSASRASKPSSGGFGSFGSRPAASPGADAHKSDSATSRKLDQRSAQANALRTLDERRQAQAARDAARPVPGYGQPAGGPPDGHGSGTAYVPAPPQAPIIVRQDSGLGNVVAGAIIARSLGNAHADNHYNSGGYYPAPGGGGGDLTSKAGADAVDTAAGDDASGASVSDAVVVIFIWLCFLALAAWVLYNARKRVKSRRKASKPNYSFERK